MDTALHSTADFLNIFLGTIYANSNNTSKYINVVCSYKTFSAKTVNSTGNKGELTKIREVYDESNGKVFLEVYYAFNTMNYTFFNIESYPNRYKKLAFIPDTNDSADIIFEYTIE